MWAIAGVQYTTATKISIKIHRFLGVVFMLMNLLIFIPSTIYVALFIDYTPIPVISFMVSLEVLYGFTAPLIKSWIYAREGVVKKHIKCIKKSLLFSFTIALQRALIVIANRVLRTWTIREQVILVDIFFALVNIFQLLKKRQRKTVIRWVLMLFVYNCKISLQIQSCTLLCMMYLLPIYCKIVK